MSEDPRNDPRVQVDSYVVYPTGYDDLVQSDKFAWCLEVTNGHAYGWSVRQAGMTSSRAMNRKGEWIWEQRGHGQNKTRRFSLEEALTIALKYVDRHKINGFTAATASAEIASRIATGV